MKTKKSFYVFVLTVFLLVGYKGMAQSAGNENNVMAVYLYNFTKFMNWPKHDSSSVFTIKVIGNSAIVKSLSEVAKRETVEGKVIDIKHIDNLLEIGYCQMLFISNSEKQNLDKILEKVKDKNILTIGNENGYCKEGVGVNFVRHGDKIKFEINLISLDEAGISANSQLLRLATKIYK